MSVTKNVIVIKIEDYHDARSMSDTLDQLLEKLAEHGVLNGEITCMGGVNITDTEVQATVMRLESLFDANIERQAAEEKAEADAVVVNLFPAPQLVQ